LISINSELKIKRLFAMKKLGVSGIIIYENTVPFPLKRRDLNKSSLF